MGTFHTSAFVKRYVAELGSAPVLSWIAHHSGNVIYTLITAQLKAMGALQRTMRGRHLDEDRARTLFRRITTHFAHSYMLIAMASLVAMQAREILQYHPVHAYGALRLACAMAACRV